jgi:hypothetical protein
MQRIKIFLLTVEPDWSAMDSNATKFGRAAVHEAGLSDRR